ncbi:protoglobin domain-containing protein [Cupriavidus pinatubonensis]|uniref:Globin-sensor domain-containing protein n=1 Tax=Cupriavidus pinatubonensis TaxID=248026 RepID=A0ABN7Z4J1_9BURK|nr:protoglobin domain-containing protein [Cupriavidus pinatubonensis]CAG9180815.1 hypothetical protein LMG23994_04500 [Cupriavidus pinatubonensis]
MNGDTIPGYLYGLAAVPASPFNLAEFELMKRSVLFDDEDAMSLRLSHDVLKDQVGAVLDVWYGFVASNSHLLAAFTSAPDGAPLSDYLAAVCKRFRQWIRDKAHGLRGSVSVMAHQS